MTKLLSPTRADYMAGKCTFADFYRAVNKTAGLVIRDEQLLDRVRRALAQGDEHLNSIPPALWDARAHVTNNPALASAFKRHGDFLSMAGGVCCYKQAAKDAAASKAEC